MDTFLRPHVPGESELRMLREGRVLSWEDVVHGLQHDPEVHQALSQAIEKTGFEAVFWECHPISRQTRDQPFSCVIVDSPRLAGVSARPAPFASHLSDGAGTTQVRTFRNLGRDAVLVAPCDSGPGSNYAHLNRFIRTAPPEQVHRLWQDVGRAMEQWWASHPTPVWLSTSGLGVHWLHIRLDQSPKYYTWTPFRRW